MKDSDDDEDSADRSEAKPDEKADSKPERSTSRASEPSRSARRTLADRVSKAQEKPAAKPAPKAKPAPRAKQKPKPNVTKANVKKPSADPKPKAKSKQADGSAEREIHRPRRQKPEKRDDRAKRDRRDEDEEGTKGAEKPKRGSNAERSRRRKPERKRDGSAGKSRKPKRSGKPLGPRVAAARGKFASKLKRAGVSTGKGIKSATPRFGRLMLAGLGTIFAAFFTVFGFLLGILIAVGLLVARPIGFVLGKLSRLTNAASRVLTPTRVLAIVVAGASVLLALSQYADFRSISIGHDAYAGGIQSVAPAPETGRLPTGDPNSYVFVPVAGVCLLLLVGALFGRWRLCRLITLAGVAAVVVALVVDRPAGMDLGDTALAFDGVRATLLGGFYAQIAAGVLLIFSSSLLARELRLAGAPVKADARRSRKRRRDRPTTRHHPGTARA